MAAIDQVLEGRSVCICAGSGGVGKTTTAAAVALGMAVEGLKVCVLTIDPAKRLADSLGMEELGNEATRVDPELLWTNGIECRGELWAMMLDAKQTFDQLVARHAEDAEARERVLGNSIYQQISSALAGSQEYMAMEKLFELHTEGRFDLLVLDTPPSRNALDFLDAPERLTQFIEGRSLQLFIKPTGLAARVAGRGAGVVLALLKRILGFDLLADLSEFFTAFSGMIEGFQDRAHRVNALLRDDQTTFLIVCGPQAEPIEESVFFHSKLVEAGMNFGAAVVNRVRYRLVDGEVDPNQVEAEVDAELDDQDLSSRLALNLAEYELLADRDEENVEKLRERLGGAPLIRVPYLDTDVHDLTGLAEIDRYLFADEATRESLAT